MNVTYKEVTTNIKMTKRYELLWSGNVSVRSGVLQYDALSPTLFILGLDSILRRLPTQIFHTLAYADDVGIICATINEENWNYEYRESTRM